MNIKTKKLPQTEQPSVEMTLTMTRKEAQALFDSLGKISHSSGTAIEIRNQLFLGGHVNTGA